MKKLFYMLLVFSLMSCEKEVPEVSFVLKLEGFSMEIAELYSGPDSLDLIPRYSGGQISFAAGDARHVFNISDGDVEDYLFRLQVGEYRLEMDIPAASVYGQEFATFSPMTETISVSESTDTITVSVKSNCSLLLVEDRFSRLDEGPYFIERHSYAAGYFISYPMTMDPSSGLYYAYFTPDPDRIDPSAFIWFYGGTPGPEAGGMPTFELITGTRYFISVLY